MCRGQGVAADEARRGDGDGCELVRDRLNGDEAKGVGLRDVDRYAAFAGV